MMIYVLLVVMTLLGAVASFFLKKATGNCGLIGLLKNINLYIGGFLYFVSAILNIVLLRYLDYSIVLPLTSLTYIWTMMISYAFLKESIGIKKIFGVVLICSGALCISA